MTIAKVSPYEQHLIAAADEVIRLRGWRASMICRFQAQTAKLHTATRNTYALGLAMFAGGLLMGAAIRWAL